MGYGMGLICPDSRALMMPMVFSNIDEVDSVLIHISPYLEAQCQEHGFVALGWSEVGFSYLYSSAAVRSLADLRGAKTLGDSRRPHYGCSLPRGKHQRRPGADRRHAHRPPDQHDPNGVCAAHGRSGHAVVHEGQIPQRYALLYSFGGLFVSKPAWERLPQDIRDKISAITHKRITELNLQVRESNRKP